MSIEGSTWVTIVTVYQFRQHDSMTGRTILSACKMLAEDIARLGGQAIEGTGEDILATALDENGQYHVNSR